MSVTDYCGWCGQQVPGDMADHDCLDPDPNDIPFRHTVEVVDIDSFGQRFPTLAEDER